MKNFVIIVQFLFSSQFILAAAICQTKQSFRQIRLFALQLVHVLGVVIKL